MFIILSRPVDIWVWKQYVASPACWTAILSFMRMGRDIPQTSNIRLGPALDSYCITSGMYTNWGNEC